ncbi:MAG: hypothetical protein HY514_01655 [Candidatus Aenigmarchaeota archaeon]|nr:hypothetical protein [Candidatus Aenigmarchaeota archaeon]
MNKSDGAQHYRVSEIRGKHKTRALQDLEKDGMIYVDGIDPEPLDQVYQQAKVFFCSPDKRKYRSLGRNWGWFVDERKFDYCSRERFIIDSSEFVAPVKYAKHYLEEKGILPAKRGMWPTYRDFPGLQPAFSRVYDHWLAFCSGMLPGYNMGSLHVCKYHVARNPKFKISPHTDDEYVIAFRPEGEALEICGTNGWISLPVEREQALLVKPETEHRVRNILHKVRYSAFFSYLADIYTGHNE